VQDTNHAKFTGTIENDCGEDVMSGTITMFTQVINCGTIAGTPGSGSANLPSPWPDGQVINFSFTGGGECETCDYSVSPPKPVAWPQFNIEATLQVLGNNHALTIRFRLGNPTVSKLSPTLVNSPAYSFPCP